MLISFDCFLLSKSRIVRIHKTLELYHILVS